ncbi:MAG TPA: tetratricopeptide repeat protein [Ktedonobacteraceae bacterium]|nr:tetratricopeptide repeat protein [Ktedonobacteraceae bacterium]
MEEVEDLEEQQQPATPPALTGDTDDNTVKTDIGSESSGSADTIAPEESPTQTTLADEIAGQDAPTTQPVGVDATTEALFCDDCGAANPAGSRFCQHCGSLIPFQRHTGTLPMQIMLAGHYQLLSRIGQGGMGAVYKAADTKLNNRSVAIKEMNRSGLSSTRLKEAEDAFEREAHLLADLVHPNLPRIHEHFTENERSYLVMDFIEGQTLEEYLEKTGGGPVPVDVVVRWATELCDVLNYLHTRQPPIIFRDLKPANVMISETGHIFLIDFGIARLFKPGKQHDTVVLGTPGYAAPEQYGKTQSSPRSDLYSLGALLHHLLTGIDPSEHPFFFSPASQVNPAVNPMLERLLKQMVEMDSGKRPTSAQEVLRTLESATTRPTSAMLANTSSTMSITDPLLEQAYRAYSQKRLDEALKLYSQALQKDSSSSLAWQGYGLTQGLRAQHQDALTSFERALQLNPGLVTSWNGKGTALSRLRRHQEALVAFERAVELDPNNAAAWNGKGATLNALGRAALALDAFDMSISHDPQLIQAWNNKGLVLYELGRFKEAQKAFEEALDLDSHNAHALFGKGQALYGQRKLKQAFTLYEQALRVDDTFADAWNRRGNVLDEMGDNGAALQSYDRALQLNPRLVAAWNGKAGVLRKLKRLFDAFTAYNHALDIDPKFALAWNGKGNTLFDMKNYAEALLSYERALQYNQRLATAWHNKSLVLYRLGRYDEALRAADEAIHMRPDDPDNWQRKADALKALNRRQEASFAERQVIYLKGRA